MTTKDEKITRRAKRLTCVYSYLVEPEPSSTSVFMCLSSESHAYVTSHEILGPNEVPGRN